MKRPNSLSVPSVAQPTYDAVTALTDSFSSEHLGDEYRNLARAVTAALCRKRACPLAFGRPRTWACGIIYVLGQLNFLADKSSEPFMTLADVCAAFGVSQSAASAKARRFRGSPHAAHGPAMDVAKRDRPKPACVGG